ncbi:MAG: molybdopterin-dependent oxidoreductase [Pseudohongiellaceae bacterium]
MKKKTEGFSRRKFIAGAGALGGAFLTGCDTELYTPPKMRSGLMGVSDVLTMASQRILMSGQGLVKEFDTSEITKDFPAWGRTNPEDEHYQQLARTGFSDWNLSVAGLVNQPSSFSLEDLKRLPSRTQTTMHICEQGWSAIAQWTGVSLMTLLEAAGGMKQEARYVVIDTYDGWYDAYDMFDVVHPQTILAYGLNGKDVPQGNGAPVRLRVERHCGYRHLKFLKSVQVVASVEEIGRGTGGLLSDYNWHWYAGA